ncbi:hypothetical protein DFH29DRAFT_157185 [Suillus ampliporus]|nr:hypothetical protein DFH29DRAFT_157185 [Suillus ampliporus]
MYKALMTLKAAGSLTSHHPSNRTGNLVFSTASSLLQHWPNTRYRNGHTIVPGTIPVGTLLYRGADTPEIPHTPDWVAMDTEHSTIYCKGSQETGCWHLTFAVTRPLKIIYFDGSSAVKLEGGPMDAQDIIAWSRARPDRLFDEERRIHDLCTWGAEYAVDGFVRMEIDFEVMLCDFSSGVEVVSVLNIEGLGIRHELPPAIPDDAKSLLRAFEIRHAGSWHDHHPGDGRIVLDYPGLISFYDTNLAPSLVPFRSGIERWDQRAGLISPTDAKKVKERLEDILRRPALAVSGVDWKTLFQVIIDRYSNRIELLLYLLTSVPQDLNCATRVQTQLRVMLTPYILQSTVATKVHDVNAMNAWAGPVFRQCASSYPSSVATLRAVMTPSERLLLQALEEVTHEICRVTTKMWASGIRARLESSEELPPPDHVHELMEEWKEEMLNLTNWLDWNTWVKCNPTCGFEEMCYLPSWPPGLPLPLPGEEDILAFSGSQSDEWRRPQPKCIRRFEPYGF